MAVPLGSNAPTNSVKQWHIRDCDDALRDELADAVGCSPLLAQLLLNRNISTQAAVRCFLEPDLKGLHDPGLLPDIDKAVARIRKAQGEKERVLIYGDYDADGVTSTSLLLQLLRVLGIDVHYYIPHRIDEGYGLNIEAVETAADEGVRLIVTCDCGTNSVAEVERARELGIDVIITDHHEPGHAIAPALAVVNAKLTGSLYPFRELAGVGVAFKLAWALAQSYSPGTRVTDEFRSFLLEAMGLVAIGTVADVVPLIDENRIFAVYGLHALRRTRSPGLGALVRQVGAVDRPLQPSDVSFKIGPRLNAAGRLAEADLCVQLLTSDSPPDAADIAQTLDAKNRQRQKIQATILASARAKLENVDDWAERRSIVLADAEWHPGVVGIVASKIAEQYSRPAVLLSIEDGFARGSARSVHAFNLFEAVDACSELLEHYGGHAAAAGMTLSVDNLDAFTERFEQRAREKLGDWEPCGIIQADAEVELPSIDRSLVLDLERLSPFGQGNPQAVFISRGVAVAGRPKLLGTSGKHVAFYIRQGDTSYRAVGFNMGDLYEPLSAGNVTCDVAYTPEINRFRGAETVELKLCDVRLH
ncbi:single-stranded-DNA-specific exonuclease RecJ [bacterium]|nr:single-stranded-DNA-specific exonuclease RecJ [bacterium]